MRSFIVIKKSFMEDLSPDEIVQETTPVVWYDSVYDMQSAFYDEAKNHDFAPIEAMQFAMRNLDDSHAVFPNDDYLVVFLKGQVKP